MHLKAITLKGFKSFPDRTRLEFGPGVSVIVGPNGSGKSNVTDAVLWALGEQSPLAVRGQSMQDVIFGGARGQQARRAAEVELVIDTDGAVAPGAVDPEFGELSIRRRLDRHGEGSYRLNGARCRLVDVLELLSDTGLGKEMHSVVSQGRVEAVVTSKPQDRRLLVEEAAGLGKHRRRRRRAQLKLTRTQDNLDRALDVEREARSRLRPLKRQAEAAELHERLARQADEARWELARDDLRDQREQLASAEAQAARARAARERVEKALADVAGRREQAEENLSQGGRRQDGLSGRRFAARRAHERVALRLEQVRSTATDLQRRADGARARLGALRDSVPPAHEADGAREAELEAQLRALDREHGAQADDALSELEERRARADAECAEAEERARGRREAVVAADAACAQARDRRRAADVAAGDAARERARLAAQIAAVDEFLRGRATRGALAGRAQPLAEQLEADEGFEHALAAALAGRLAAATAPTRAAGAQLLDSAGDDGGRVLVVGARRHAEGARSARPAPGARRLLDHVRGPDEALGLARFLLADAWVVEDVAAVGDDFTGIAVTMAGRAWLAGAGELHQAPAGAEDRVLAERNRRSLLAAQADDLAEAEREAAAAAEVAACDLQTAERDREAAERALAGARAQRESAAERRRAAAWMIDQRASAPDSGPRARRRGEVEAALAAERRLAAQAEAARRRHSERLAAESARLHWLESLAPAAERLETALSAAGEAIDLHARALEEILERDREAAEGLAGRLREFAHEEAELQSRLRTAADDVTTHEVGAQRLRDRADEVAAELGGVAARLELAAEPAGEALGAEEREALAQRIARLARRREQLGPVNPLAQDEYTESLAHVSELEERRGDLETALRELGSLIAETDRRIREAFDETFTATARNFEELIGDLFPGGRGRLALVSAPAGPSPVLGESVERDASDGEDDGDAAPADDDRGVEIEVTPAGKAAKRLSLLSGGEKSLTALAFLFAVFLARPCPFYVLDEVEASLDDLNIDRFLRLLRRYSSRAQFIVVTHQKRTMEAADTLYGVSMGDDGISKVISRRLPRDEGEAPDDAVVDVARDAADAA